MKRSYKLANKKRFILFITIISMVLYLTGMIVNAGAASQETVQHQIIKVQKGDTLWEIAQTNCSEDPRHYIYQIKQLNRLEQDTIYEGQVLLLP